MVKYIEREALREELRKYQYPHELVVRKRGRCKFCEDLDWLWEVVCYHPNDNGGATDIPINYCPNCGADMREKA